jgi:hypothetical protein
MTTDFCPHIVCAHDVPEHPTDHYDNITLLLGCARALFEVISDAAEDEPGVKRGQPAVSTVAYLGGHLCNEIERRVDVFYESVTGTSQRAVAINGQKHDREEG